MPVFNLGGVHSTASKVLVYVPMVLPLMLQLIMIKVAIQPVLVYGCATIKINPGAMKTLEKTQGRLVKSALGPRKYCRNTPLLNALEIRTIRQVVNNNQLSIIRNAMWNTSRAIRNFYMCMLKKYERGVITYKHNSLISRSKHICDSEHISLTLYDPGGGL